MGVEMLVRSVLASALMASGGLALLGTLAIDYTSGAGFWIFIVMQGTGFVLVLVASALAYGTFGQKWAWGAFVAASALWLIGSSWFLSLGFFVYVPLVVWAVISSVLYLSSSFIAGIHAEPIGAAVAGILAVGSMLSTGVTAANPVFASDYTFTPFAGAALLGGVVVGVGAVTNRGTRARAASRGI